MKKGLSGYLIVRNGLSLDYCFEVAIASLLPICNEVVVCDSDSTDGTLEHLQEMQKSEPKIRIVNYPWRDPVGDVSWLTTWMNHARQYLEYDTQLYLDADEVLHPSSYPLLQRNISKGTCFWFHRLNFWRDHRTLVPIGHCCSHEVARFGPTSLWQPSDEIHCEGQHPGPEPEMRLRAKKNPNLVIFHFGFIRKREAFFKKAKVVLKGLLGTYDDRLVAAEADPSKPWEDFALFPAPMGRYDGTYPPVAHQWLRERGFEV